MIKSKYCFNKEKNESSSEYLYSLIGIQFKASYGP